MFIITAFCWMDDILKATFKGQRLRQRGPEPTLSDAEVLTMEVVGEYLGLGHDQALYQYFRRHYSHFSPALGGVHRTTLTRQAANLWKVKELVWRRLLELIPYDPTFALVDSFPLLVCQFARAYRCRRFKGEAAFGWDNLVRQTFYGFRVHVRWCWPGVITHFDSHRPMFMKRRWFPSWWLAPTVCWWETATTGIRPLRQSWRKEPSNWNCPSAKPPVTLGPSAVRCSVESVIALKLSGAWWYVELANVMLALRCAK